jgi:hypothetical protein
MSQTIPLRDLRAGDYVVPANATVKETDLFAGLIIVDFTDNTATPPIPSDATVEVIRGNAQPARSAVPVP